MANTLKCTECCFYWKEVYEDYASCHWTERCPDDFAPCEEEDCWEEEDGWEDEMARDYEWSCEPADPLDKPATEITPWDVYSVSELL